VNADRADRKAGRSRGVDRAALLERDAADRPATFVVAGGLKTWTPPSMTRQHRRHSVALKRMIEADLAGEPRQRFLERPIRKGE
jgi:hypothetical protein